VSFGRGGAAKIACKFKPLGITVSKASTKLGITIPKRVMSSIVSGRNGTIRLTLENELGSETFLALPREWIGIPSALARKLGLRHKSEVYLAQIEVLRPVRRPRRILSDQLVDLLAFVPAGNIDGHNYAVDEYRSAGGEQRLRLWCYHRRGSARQIDIRRRVGAREFGLFLGQYQAEGDKENRHRVSFTNTLVSEHADFVRCLRAIGIADEQVSACVVYNPARLDEESLQTNLHRYFERTGIKVGFVRARKQMKGSCGFVTTVRSVILKGILDRALASARETLTSSQPVPGMTELLKGFVAKLLTGDGTLDVSVRPTRITTSVKILDRVEAFRRDYSAMLLRLGFSPRISEKRIEVKSYCRLDNLLSLYEMNAFHGTPNWIKLLCAVRLSLQGSINKGYEKLCTLAREGRFTTLAVSKAFRIRTRSANLWIHSMMKRRLVQQTSKFRGHSYITYGLTDLGLRRVELLRSVLSEYATVCHSLGESDPLKLIDMVRARSPFKQYEGGLPGAERLGSE